MLALTILSDEQILKGLESWAGILGGGTAFATGVVAMAITSAGGEGDFLADQINKALGRGFFYGLVVGAFVYVAYAFGLAGA